MAADLKIKENIKKTRTRIATLLRKEDMLVKSSPSLIKMQEKINDDLNNKKSLHIYAKTEYYNKLKKILIDNDIKFQELINEFIKMICEEDNSAKQIMKKIKMKNLEKMGIKEEKISSQKEKDIYRKIKNKLEKNNKIK